MKKERPKEQTERLFCLDDQGECVGLSHQSQIVNKEKATITVRGKKLHGWIVTIRTPATDGLVRSTPQGSASRPVVPDEE